MINAERKISESPVLLQQDNPNLDFLRALAVSMVVAFHFLLYFGIWRRYPDRLAMLGFTGVLFFFVHTSLVLMFSLNRLSHKFSGAKLYFSFMIRRVFRIYPLSILAIAVIAVFHLPLGGLSPLTFRSVVVSKLGLVSNLLLTQNLTNTQSILGPLWSLPLEMQMYFFLPLLFLLARRIQSVRPLLLLWALAVALALLQPRIDHLPDLLRFVPCFLPGIIAFKVGKKHVRRLPFAVGLAFLGAMIVILLFIPHLEAGWFACLFTGLAIPRIAILSNDWVRKTAHLIAKYSYGIYLGHYFCIWFALVKLHALPLPVRLTVLLLSLVALPVAVFHLAEQPLISYGARVVEVIFQHRPLIPGKSSRPGALRVPA